ncbi:MAG: hypothetical protein FWD23_16100, partial [Oscillospiraceae bacterium]|nr:hypothetical protein [Oscillospiraceae bacterium]
YGQIKSGMAVEGHAENNILMEVQAKEKLIKYQKAYKITDYEIDVIKNSISEYKEKLENLKKGDL